MAGGLAPRGIDAGCHGVGAQEVDEIDHGVCRGGGPADAPGGVGPAGGFEPAHGVDEVVLCQAVEPGLEPLSTAAFELVEAHDGLDEGDLHDVVGVEEGAHGGVDAALDVRADDGGAGLQA